jgi:serine/threonine protein kinase
MIYERQIKRVIQYFNYGDLLTFGNIRQSPELFVISSSDPSMFLNYASISPMYMTLDRISDPIDLEFWIYMILDYLAFMHRSLNLVNLDIKPQNIFLNKSRQL